MIKNIFKRENGVFQELLCSQVSGEHLAQVRKLPEAGEEPATEAAEQLLKSHRVGVATSLGKKEINLQTQDARYLEGQCRSHDEKLVLD